MKQMIFVSLITLLSISNAFAAINITDFTINDIKNSLPEGVSIPPELEGIPIPSIDNATQLFKEKCVKESGSDASYEQVSQASTNLMECAQRLVNLTALPEEIEKAKPNGNLDTVFNKYCNKRNEAIECVESFTNSLDPCLSQEERDQKVVIVNITKSLLEFICHENGNQIALFIAEEGPECFEANQDELQNCFSETMGKYTNDELPTLENLPTLIIKEEHCRDMDKLEVCVVKKLEKCKESTPANLVEALFRFVRKETPCANPSTDTNKRLNESRFKRHIQLDLPTMNIDDIQKNLPEGVTLPPEIQSLRFNEIEELLRNKCKKESSGDTAYENAKQAFVELSDCTSELFDYSTIQDEIDAAKLAANGNLDTVFEKYCDKRGDAVTCVENYLKTLDPCLNDEERDQKATALKMTKSLLDFACHQNGRYIALFIAEKGPECFEENQQGLQDCFNITLSKHTNGEAPTLENLPSFTASKESCKDMDELERCLVGELDNCEDITPANIVEAVFRFVRKETPCRRFIEASEESKRKTSKRALALFVGTFAIILIILMKVQSRRMK